MSDSFSSSCRERIPVRMRKGTKTLSGCCSLLKHRRQSIQEGGFPPHPPATRFTLPPGGDRELPVRNARPRPRVRGRHCGLLSGSLTLALWKLL